MCGWRTKNVFEMKLEHFQIQTRYAYMCPVPVQFPGDTKHLRQNCDNCSSTVMKLFNFTY